MEYEVRLAAIKEFTCEVCWALHGGRLTLYNWTPLSGAPECPNLQRVAAECTTDAAPMVSCAQRALGTGGNLALHTLKYDLYSPGREYADWDVQRPSVLALTLKYGDAQEVSFQNNSNRTHSPHPTLSPVEANHAAVRSIFRHVMGACAEFPSVPCGVIIRAAAECGVQLDDLLYRETTNLGHHLAMSSLDWATPKSIGARLTELRECLPLGTMRALLAQRDDAGRTPYDCAWEARGSEFAEMFRPSMPKSAAH